MDRILTGIILAIPLFVNILAVALLRGGYRILACLPLVVLALAYALDFLSVIGRGNLAGLFTIIAAGPSLALLVVIFAARLTASLLDRWRRRRNQTVDADGPEG